MRDDSDTAAGTGVPALRRDVMKALSVGTAVGVLGGAASGQADDDDDEEGDDAGADDGRQVDDDDSVAGDNTVHVVRTLIGPSTNPERPADFYYQPTGLAIDPGDVVRFVFPTPDHTVTSYHPAFGMQRRLPGGVDPISAPITGWDPDSLPDDIDEPPAEPGAGGGEEMEQEGDGTDGGEQSGPRPSTWLHAFDTPGVYDLECAPHETFGMAMRVVVGDQTDTDFEVSDPSALPEPRAGPVGLARQVLTDPNLRPEAIYQEGRVEWQDLEVNQQASSTETETGTEAETGTATETEAETATETTTES